MDSEKTEEDATIKTDLTLFIEIHKKFGPLGKPAIRFSKFLSDRDAIEALIKKSLDGEIIIAKIKFNNKTLAVARLVRLGLVDPNNL